MTVSLRAARESDIEALVVLDSRAFADPDRPDNDETHSFMADWFRAMIGEGLTRCLVTPDDALIGVMVIKKEKGTSPVCHIEHIAIDPDYQALGFGKQLLEIALQESDRQECPTSLYVFNQNARAIRLYKNMGFCNESALHPDKLKSSDTLYMVRQPS